MNIPDIATIVEAFGKAFMDRAAGGHLPDEAREGLTEIGGILNAAAVNMRAAPPSGPFVSLKVKGK